MDDVHETLKIAIELGKMYLTALQFFVAICSLFGGWIVVNGLPKGLYTRTLLSFTFVAPSATLLVGMNGIDERVEATIIWARKLALAAGDGFNADASSSALFSTNPKPSYLELESLGMSAIILGLVALIFLAKDTAKK